MKKALITGITGQDGSYLAEFLLAKGYEVHGIIRRASTFNTGRIDHLYKDPHINGVHLFLHYGDIADSTNLIKLLYRIQPDEVYHLAAQSHVRVSFDIPEYTGDVTALSTIRILEAIRETGVKSKFYQASSSEMFGKVHETPQRLIIASRTISSPVAAYSSITKVLAAARRLSRERSRAQSLALKQACKRNFILATSMRSGIGAMPGSTWKQCG